ncbi:MAG TPA: DUF1707 domain-containing protein, partial [Acidimicrobiales bacterium]|nr:DUF1707 domain-containing protein [Acidimicrobiales bacterium]
MSDRGDHRIGDAERQQAIDVLRTHTGAGRLSLDEFSDLAGRVYEARTVAELEAVGRSLPPGLVDQPPEPAPAVAPAPRHRAHATPVEAAGAAAVAAEPTPRRFVGIMSGARARGAWRPGPKVKALAFWGGVSLDFRYAEFDGPVDVTATAVMGGVTITVAEGTRVDLDGMVIMGGSTNATRAVAPDPRSPVIRVHARGLWGGVTVWSRKTREQRAAAAAEAGVDPREVDAGARGLLELPQRVLEDIAAGMPGILAGPGGGGPSPWRDD